MKERVVRTSVSVYVCVCVCVCVTAWEEYEIDSVAASTFCRVMARIIQPNRHTR